MGQANQNDGGGYCESADGSFVPHCQLPVQIGLTPSRSASPENGNYFSE